MIASIGFCICKCEAMNFLCEQWERRYYATFLQQACWMRDVRSFSDEPFLLKCSFCGKKHATHKYFHRIYFCSGTLAGSGRFPMWSKTGEGLWHVEWLRLVGLSKGFFWGTGLNQCLPHTRHALPPGRAPQCRNQQYFCFQMYIFNL